MRRGITALAAIALLGGCIGPPVEVPSAVIDVDPGAICEGDGYATPIVLDGSRSSGHLAVVSTGDESATPLAFRWAIEGSAYVIDAGSLERDTVVIRAAGDRPIHVSLTVDDGAGGVATSTRTVAITLAEAGSPCAP